MTSEKIKSLIIEGVEAVLKEKNIEADVDGDFHLFGSGSLIDSLDLVGIVVQLEEGIRNETGRDVEIVDEDAIVSSNSPFRTINSMTDYVMGKLAA